MRGVGAWGGYSPKPGASVRQGRAAGTTKYPFMKMLKLALNAMFSFSALPLKMITWVGFVSVLISIALIFRTLYYYFVDKQDLVLGWASIIVLISFFSGVILLSIGV